MTENITPEIIRALRKLRDEVAGYAGADLTDAFNVLDNAGIFSEIDAATGYDVDPAPEQASKCTCPRTYGGEFLRQGHRTGCPGDPAEWGDMASGAAPARKTSKERKAEQTARWQRAVGIRRDESPVEPTEWPLYISREWL